MADSKRIFVPGTESIQLPEARAIGPTDPDQPIEVSVVLRHRKPLPDPAAHGEPMSQSGFARAYGASPDDIEKTRQFARENNLEVLERGDEAIRRTVTLTGTAANMEKAFGVELTEFEYPEGSYRGYAGSIQVPEEIAPIVTGVFGLDDRPAAGPHKMSGGRDS